MYDDGITPEVLEDANISYDADIPYEDQVPAPSNKSTPALADRIGNTKVYLLSESRLNSGKRKRRTRDLDGEEVGTDEDDDVDMEQDVSHRTNAILFHGSPISHLPTTRLFAYATHFDAQPMGLEWIDDATCVFVFPSKSAARSAFRTLQKSTAEQPDDDGNITAKPIPVELWPPEERITSILGKAEGLKGSLRMRWARADDVKKKGANKESEFYRKHGVDAGKDLHGEETGQRKRRIGNGRDVVDAESLKARLDDDLDRFLDAGSEDDSEALEDSTPLVDEPPSRMRSDYIARDGRTLLERTSLLPTLPDTLASRITAPLPKRAQHISSRDEIDVEGGVDAGQYPERRRRGGRTRGRRGGWENAEEASSRKRPRKSQQELDDELDAFLQHKD